MIFRDYVAPQSMLNSPVARAGGGPAQRVARPGRRWMATDGARCDGGTPR